MGWQEIPNQQPERHQVNNIEIQDHTVETPPVGVPTWMLVTDAEGNVYRWPMTELVLSSKAGA